MALVTVTNPVTGAARMLASLEDVKADLGIKAEDTSKDALLGRWIIEASDDLASLCGVAPDQRGRRTFVKEPLTITIEADDRNSCYSRPNVIVLPWRLPLEITSLTVDGALAEEDSYVLDPMACLLRGVHSYGKVVIAGTAGFDPEESEVPAALVSALSGMIKSRNDGYGRDAALKRIRVDGVGEREYFEGGAAGTSSGAAGGGSDGSSGGMASLEAAGLVNIPMG